MIYYEYHKVTGQIMLIGTSNLLALTDIETHPEHTMSLGDVDWVNQYRDIGAGKLAARPSNPISADVESVVANATDKVTFKDVPEGTEVEVINEGVSTQAVVTGGSLEMTFDKVGQYKVVLGSFPMLKKEFDINAT